MAAQSLLAKLGMRMATLGSAASLALAAPLSEGDYSMAAHTDASRIGMYFDRTAAAEKMGHVVMGTEVLSVAVGLITAQVPLATPASALSSAGLNIGQGVAPTTPVDGDLWIQATGLFYRANGSTVGPIVAGGTIGGTIAADQVAVGSGADTIAGYSTLTWTAAAGLSSNRSGTTSCEMFGAGAGNASLTGTYDTLVGATVGASITTGAYNTAVGAAALSAATIEDDCTAVGYAALQSCAASANTAVGSAALQQLTSGTLNTALGRAAGAAVSTGSYNIFLGAYAGDNSSTSLSNTLIAGSDTAAISDVILGNGEVNASPTSVTIFPTGGSGTDIGGGSLNLAGGRPTGSGAGGAINLRTAAAGATGTTLRSWVTRVSVLQDGAFDWTGIVTASEPAVSATDHGTIFYDSTLQKFRYSANGSAYADLVGAGGGIGGSIAANQVAFGSGADTIQGDNKFQFTVASGLVVNLASSGADNLTIGATAGNSLTSGAQNTLLGTNAGTALTTTNDGTAVGFNALAACTVADNTAVGSGAADAVSTSARVVAVGKDALGTGTTGVSDCTAIGYQALALNTAADNTAVGSQALALNTAANNTAVGSQAADAVTTSTRIVAVGREALGAGSTGVSDSTAVGYNALLLCTAASNTAVGSLSSDAITTGTRNTSVGYQSNSALQTNNDNTAVGYNALASDTAGQNTAVGSLALVSTTQASNTAVGYAAGRAITSGGVNTVVGTLAMGTIANAITSSNNVAVGGQALCGTGGVGPGNSNVAVGFQSLFVCTAAENTAVGTGSLQSITTGTGCVAVGYTALQANTASNNTAVGHGAADLVSTSTRIVAMGKDALGAGTTGVSDCTAIGYNALVLYTGADATAVGSNAAAGVTTSANITAIGKDTLSAAGAAAAVADNTAVGYRALAASTAINNTAVGSLAADAVTTSANVTAVGAGALGVGSTGVADSTAIGYNALAVSTGANNTALGSAAADGVTSSARVVAVGKDALGSASAAAGVSDSVALGYQALLACTAADNVAVGSGASDALTSSTRTVSVGRNALGAGTTGVSDCTAVGYQALLLATGANNTAVGSAAGDTITTGSGNTFIGYTADATVNSVTDCIAIGYGASVTASGQVAIGSITAPISEVYFNGFAGGSGLPVRIQASGTSGLNSSGSSLTIAPGNSTGNFDPGTGTAGCVVIQSNAPAASSSTKQTLTNRVVVDHGAGAGTTCLRIYDVDNAAIERVSVGAADSGGVGFKVLRIPN